MKSLGIGIKIVAGLHGNERMPVQALTEAGVDFVLGSPKGYEQNVRFLEADLNASFGVGDTTYESQRAAEILKEIPDDAIVVDFHTTDAAPPPFVIVVDEKMIPLAATTGLRHVVIMKHNIKNKHALINYRRGISVEVGRHADEKSYRTTLDVLQAIRVGKELPVHLYEVFGELREPGDYVNFREHAEGYFPVLAHEPTYEFQGLYGLKARAV